MRAAFTFVEIAASLLLLVVGMAAIAGILGYGLRLGEQAQMQSLAALTAETALHDPEPYGAPYSSSNEARQAAGWTNSSGEASGFLNGFYVERSLTSKVTITGSIASQVITVSIRQSRNGGEIFAIQKRMVSK